MKAVVRFLPTLTYESTYKAMQNFTIERNPSTLDEIWFLQHYPVYTQGYAGKEEHILAYNEIPIVQTDRGGQITYHGPGQLIMYVLLDLRRLQLSVHALVSNLQSIIIKTLFNFGVLSHLNPRAPGVYVEQKKICSIGLRVKRGCCYHGIALNISTDLTPFHAIRPCGLNDIQMTNLEEYSSNLSFSEIANHLLSHVQTDLGYTSIESLTQSTL